MFERGNQRCCPICGSKVLIVVLMSVKYLDWHVNQSLPYILCNKCKAQLEPWYGWDIIKCEGNKKEIYSIDPPLSICQVRKVKDIPMEIMPWA